MKALQELQRHYPQFEFSYFVKATGRGLISWYEPAKRQYGPNFFGDSLQECLDKVRDHFLNLAFTEEANLATIGLNPDGTFLS